MTCNHTRSRHRQGTGTAVFAAALIVCFLVQVARSFFGSDCFSAACYKKTHPRIMRPPCSSISAARRGVHGKELGRHAADRAAAAGTAAGCPCPGGVALGKCEGGHPTLLTLAFCGRRLKAVNVTSTIFNRKSC